MFSIILIITEEKIIKNDAIINTPPTFSISGGKRSHLKIEFAAARVSTKTIIVSRVTEREVVSFSSWFLSIFIYTVVTIITYLKIFLVDLHTFFVKR